MTEAWVPVVGYEGIYEVSDAGNVRRIAGGHGAIIGRILKPAAHKTGHLQVVLYKYGKSATRKVHRLVAIAFMGAGIEGQEVCHNDGNPANNFLANLRWGTHAENMQDAVAHGTLSATARTHCPQSHPYDADNTYIASSGQRVCRECRKGTCARYYLRKKAARA